MLTQLDIDDLRGVMDMLKERGWEPTEAIYQERARDAKREWTKVTTKPYGKRLAADWRPDKWLADFDHMTVADAEARVTDARDALTVLHKVSAVSEAEVDKVAQGGASAVA